jgi:hypothetical protein
MASNQEGFYPEGECLDDELEIVLDDNWVEEKEIDKSRQRIKKPERPGMVDTEFTTL